MALHLQEASKERRVIRGWDAASHKTGRSRAQLWRDVRGGSFPAPFQLGPNSVGWFEDEINNWLLSRPRRTYNTTAAA
jgi:prophage regulatory protein